jgi:NADH:ubiquinone oxidoreductase subunit 2 (subunit N)
VLAIGTSVVAVVYYARVVVAMYFREPSGAATADRSIDRPVGAALVIAVVGTVLLGLAPGLWYTLLERGQNLLVFVAAR